MMIKKIVRQIKKYVKEYKKAESKVRTYSSGEQLLEAKLDFQIIFLDIDMAGLNGIETAKKVRNHYKSVKIIYVTRFTDYVNLAFEVHAFGYLNKPIKKEEICKQLDEAVEYSKEERKEDYIEFVTLFYIRTIKGYDIFMTDGNIIPLSQKKSAEFREQFNIFLENHI